MRRRTDPRKQSSLLSGLPAQREIVRVEKNLNTFGFFTPSSKRLRAQSKSVTLQVRTEDGRKLEATATIFPAAELGLPTTADQDKYFAFQKIVERIRKRDGVVQNPVRFSSATLIEILGMTHGGKNYREIWEWLRRMTLTGVESQGVVYFAGRKKYARDLFHVFQRSVAVGEVLEDGSGGRGKLRLAERLATGEPQQPLHAADRLRRLQDAAIAYCEGAGPAAADLVLRQPAAARREAVLRPVLAAGIAAFRLAFPD